MACVLAPQSGRGRASPRRCPLARSAPGVRVGLGWESLYRDTVAGLLLHIALADRRTFTMGVDAARLHGLALGREKRLIFANAVFIGIVNLLTTRTHPVLRVA